MNHPQSLIRRPWRHRLRLTPTQIETLLCWVFAAFFLFGICYYIVSLAPTWNEIEPPVNAQEVSYQWPD